MRPLENPGISQAAPADHHKVRAGMREDARHVLGRKDVPIGRNRDGDRLLDRADNIPVGCAAILLAARAAVDGYHIGSGLLAQAGKLHAVDALRVPAHAELDRDRHGHGLLDRRDDARGQVR